MKPFIAACIQTNSRADIEENLMLLEPLLKEAARQDASFIALPENVCMMVKGKENIIAQSRSEDEHPAIAYFKNKAREMETWIEGGTLAIKRGDGKLANRAYLYNPAGEIAAFYDKIHMFDAELSGSEKYLESETFHSGDKAVLADAVQTKVGLTICYDLRFPHLYRALAKGGAGLITVPAAFTVTTGKMHWHVLLRARAIETGAFILAPAQTGDHQGGRETYGHSLIIDPLGGILAEAVSNGSQVVTAEIDLAKVAAARRMLPSLQHDRAFTGPS